MDEQQKPQIIDLTRLNREGFGIIVQGELRRLPGGKLVDAILLTFQEHKRQELTAREIWKAVLN